MFTLIVQKNIALNLLKKVTFLTFFQMAIKFSRIIFLFVFILMFFLIYTLKRKIEYVLLSQTIFCAINYFFFGNT